MINVNIRYWWWKERRDEKKKIKNQSNKQERIEYFRYFLVRENDKIKLIYSKVKKCLFYFSGTCSHTFSTGYRYALFRCICARSAIVQMVRTLNAIASFRICDRPLSLYTFESNPPLKYIYISEQWSSAIYPFKLETLAEIPKLCRMMFVSMPL